VRLKEILQRLIDGETFTLFNQEYRINGISQDGIYDYKIRDRRGMCVGMARFRYLNKHVMLAFSYGRFILHLNEFVYNG
jgi:hypothetical protein